MSLLAYVVTALLVVVVVLTRLRMRREDAAGRVATSGTWLRLHTVAGLVGAVVWVVFLVFPEDSVAGGSLVGVIGLFCWWLVSIAGLALMLRWLPSKGRHAGTARTDGWSRGPLLSVLAHVGAFIGVVYLTWAYVFRIV